MKKIQQTYDQGYQFNATIAIKYILQTKDIEEHEKLYPTTFYNLILNTFNFDNVIDSLLSHIDNIDDYFQQLIHYGSINCRNCLQVQNYLTKINQINDYKSSLKIYFTYQFYSIQDIYQLLTTQTIQSLNIDIEHQIEQFTKQLESHQFNILDKIVQKLILNLIVNDIFDHELYESIYSQNLNVSNEIHTQINQIWIKWFETTSQDNYNQIIYLFNQNHIKDQSSFLDIYNQFKITTERINTFNQKIIQLENSKIDYNIQKCRLIQQQIHSNLQEIIKSLEIGNNFEIIFYYNYLKNYWNINVIDFPLEIQQKQDWDLAQVDYCLPQIYQLSKHEIPLDQIFIIIKKILGDLDVPFSIQYRNLAGALHPEKAKEFYQNIFKEGKFNNNQLKRIPIPSISVDIINEPNYQNFAIITPQKSLNQLQLGQWAKQQPVQQVQTKPVEQQQKSRFGIGFKWNKS